MKVVYVVPGPMDKKEVNRRGKLLQSWANINTEVDIVAAEEGPASIESMYEEYLSIPATAKIIYELEKKNYDAAILGCAGDPGLDAMREVTDKMLVLGPGQTSMITGAMLGNKFSVITIEDSMINSSYELAYKAGVLEKLASVVSVNVPVLELRENREKSLKKIIDAGKKAVENDRADSLVLGCMTMGFLDIAEEIEKEVGVPVINPSKVGLKMAEALVGSGLMHSKKAFATPLKLKSGKVNSLDELNVK
jgi:allantoin racemase